MKFENFRLSELKTHPLNEKLSLANASADFISSIAKYGIVSPITVCRSSDPSIDGCIVKGRRRCSAALLTGIEFADCIVWECNDPLIFEEHLILDNLPNENSVECKVRMYNELLRIETDRAAKRQEAARFQPKSDPVVESPPLSPQNNESNPSHPVEKGRAEDIAANRVGMSRTTARAAAEVIKKVDELRNSGETEKADSIVKTMNNVSVRAAKNAIEKEVAVELKTGDIDKSLARLESLIGKFDCEINVLVNAVDSLSEKSRDMAANKKNYESLLRKLSDLTEPVQYHMGVMREAWKSTRRFVNGQ